MKVDLKIDAEPGLQEVLEPSLEGDQRVSYVIEKSEELEITVETDSLGPLRGATDTVFRLAMLRNKILQR